MKDNEITIRPARAADLDAIAKINSQVFLGNRDNLEKASQWIDCLFNSFPIYHYYVLTLKGTKKIIGYIGWQVHGGFLRSSPVIELEQIGIDSEFQKQGLAIKLIKQSMQMMVDWMQDNNTRIESHIHFIVWVYAHNQNAVKVYKRIFDEAEKGRRSQYGDREEIMLRKKVIMVRPAR